MLKPGRYIICDIETSIFKTRKWTASPFAKNPDGSWANGLYYFGYRRYDETENKAVWTRERPGLPREIPRGLLDGIDVLVGHNWLGYDMHWFWDDPYVWGWLKRGGRIHDTAYCQYMLKAQLAKWQYPSLNDTCKEYGGTEKVDAVKACWMNGIDTPDIPEELMLEYLLGNGTDHLGDIGNTLVTYLGQVEKLNQLKMDKAFLLRSDGLMCTSMMTFNGIHVDMQLAEKMLKEKQEEYSKLEVELRESLPADLPPEIDWTWSPNQKSYILFGGAIKFERVEPWVDEHGQPTYKKATADAHLWKGKPVPLDIPIVDGCFISPKNGKRYECDRFLSGKREGELKTKKVPIRGEAKFKKYERIYDMRGCVQGRAEWKNKTTDARGGPIYSTGADTIAALEHEDIAFVKKFTRYSALAKEISVYLRTLDKKGEPSGLLTLVQPWDGIIHHKLNSTATVSLRYSASDPNMQNIPRKDKSNLKDMFRSRFEGGLLIENDYSQLEVVGQAMLSGDPAMIADVCARIDFHCKRVSMQYGVTYEEAVRLCKDEDGADYPLWKKRRTGCKAFSFQRAYGAGAAKIAAYTGIPEETVKEMIANEERAYPGVLALFSIVLDSCEKTGKPFFDPECYKTFRRGWWRSPFGSIYSFRTYEAPAYKKKHGIEDDWMPTELKNYPIQGESGFVVQAAQGRLCRHFIALDNYSEEGDFRKPGALLINTVHDCNQADSKRHLAYTVAMDMKRIMESIPEILKEEYDYDCPVPFPADSEIGESLLNLHHAETYKEVV